MRQRDYVLERELHTLIKSLDDLCELLQNIDDGKKFVSLTGAELKRIRNVVRDTAAYLALHFEQIKEKVASLGATRPGQTI